MPRWCRPTIRRATSMGRRMDIHYVINSLDGGGAALPMPDIVAVLQAHGHAVRVSGLRPKDGRACARLDAAHVQYEILGTDRCGNALLALRLWRRLLRDRPGLIWTSLSRATVLGQVTGCVFGIPVVSWQHNAFLRSEEHTSELQSLMRNSYAV